MIRFKLAELLKARGWTAYRLAQETGFSMPRAYKLAAGDAQFAHYRTETLDRLCAALHAQPGDLLEYVPDKRVKGR